MTHLLVQLQIKLGVPCYKFMFFQV